MAAVLRCVPGGRVSASQEAQGGDPFVGVPLPVLAVAAERIEALASGVEDELCFPGSFPLAPEDRYLLLPEDIALDLVDILADGDEELWAETLRDGLLVEGACEHYTDGVTRLLVRAGHNPGEWFRSARGYARTLGVGPGSPDPLQRLNRDAGLRCTMLGGLLDEEGLDRVLAAPCFLGVGWRPPARYALQGLCPTWVWSRRLPDGSAAVEFVLFQEEDELSAMLRPVRFVFEAE